MRLLLLLGITALLMPYQGQSQDGLDSTFYLKKVKATVLSNKTIGIADTVLALIQGKVVDDQRTGVESRVTCIDVQGKKETTFITGESGLFRYFIPAGTYKVTFRQSGYGSLTIDTLELKSGQMQEINISLGSAYVVQDWIRITGDTLTIAPKRRKPGKSGNRH